MNVVISHISALRFWCSGDHRRFAWEPVYRPPTLPQVPFGASQARSIVDSLPFDLGRPLHVLAMRASPGRQRNAIVCHRCQQILPHQYLVQLGCGVYVCRPELAMAQVARFLSEIDLIRVGYRICSLPGYDDGPSDAHGANLAGNAGRRIDDGALERAGSGSIEAVAHSSGSSGRGACVSVRSGSEGVAVSARALDVAQDLDIASYDARHRVSDGESISSVNRIHALLDLTPGVQGTRAVSWALRHILDDSASSRETMLAIHLTLPYRLGGCSLPHPILNCKIPLASFEKGLAGKEFYRADMYWPDQKVAVEYDSDTWHSGRAANARDSHRRDVLAHKGIIVIGITTDQLDDLVEFNKVAGIISKKIGKRISPRDDDFVFKQMELRRALMKPEPWI